MKAKDFLNYELQDGPGETGGISFRGETLENFLNEVFPDENIEDMDMKKVNEALESCGIEPIKESNETLQNERDER